MASVWETCSIWCSRDENKLFAVINVLCPPVGSSDMHPLLLKPPASLTSMLRFFSVSFVLWLPLNAKGFKTFLNFYIRKNPSPLIDLEKDPLWAIGLLLSHPENAFTSSSSGQMQTPGCSFHSAALGRGGAADSAGWGGRSYTWQTYKCKHCRTAARNLFGPSSVWK